MENSLETVVEINKALKTTTSGRKRNNLRNILDYDEIDEGIFLSSWALPRDVLQLRKLGITHVLNVAEGTTYECNTGPMFYRDTNITYKGIAADDLPSYDLSQHFEQSIGYISSAINSGGKVLVHCLQGVSRSATIVAAYLVKEKAMSSVEAIKLIKSKREIFPNFGFIKQIADYDQLLRKVNDKNAMDFCK